TLVKRLGQLSGRQRSRDPWVDFDKIRQAVPRDAVLIEIAKFPVWDFRDPANQVASQPARYVAWVVPPAGQGNVHVIDLGVAARNDAAIKSVLQSMETAAATIYVQGERDSDKELRQQTGQLARLVLHPLAARISKSKRWIISPDSALWLIPWSALPLP